MVRIFIVDDHASFRDSLVFLLEYQEDFTVVGKAGTFAEASVLLATTDIDVALVDLDLPDGHGLDLLPKIHERNPGVPAIILTGSVRPESKALAIAAGAVGFLHKSTNVTEIVQSISRVASGQSLLSVTEAMSLMRQASQYQARSQTASNSLQKLTPREREVLLALVDGLDNQGIAQRLSLSTATVRSHVVQVLDKLNVESRLQAALFAVRSGLVAPDEFE